MDLYALLGLNRAASVAQIERAFRRLSRRYHPGVNPGDRAAEDVYRRVQEAYAVLGDDARRRAYDNGARPDPPVTVTSAVSLEGFDFSAPAEGPLAATFSELFADVFLDAAREATIPAAGGDIEISARVGFLDAVRGAAVPLSITRRERCGACLGQGRSPRPAVVCAACDGSGSRRWARGHMVFTKACETCAGAGRVTADVCRACAGAGVASRSEVVTVQIPPGIESGARVVAPGRGHAGARGGAAGDLYVTVDVADHPHFQRDGSDLHLTLPVAFHEAALGAEVDAPTLDGAVRVRIPAGTSSGHRLRIRGGGLPRTAPEAPGDLIVHVRIVAPSVVDARSADLLQEFSRLNPGDVRRSLFE